MLLQKDPNKRITLEQLKSHPWVSSTVTGISFDDSLNLVNFQDIDQDVVQIMKNLGIDTTSLVDKLLNNQMCRETSSYKIIRREKITNQITKLYSSMSSHRNSAYLSPKPLPAIAATSKLAQTRNHQNSMSTPDHNLATLSTVRMKKRPACASPLVPKVIKRRTRAFSFMKQCTPPPVMYVPTQ